MASASRPRAVRRDDAEQPATASVEAGRSVIDLQFVRGLIEAVDNSSIDSLELNRAGTRIRISKTPPAAAVIAPHAHAQPMMPAPAAPAAAPGAAAPAPTPAPAPAAAPASNLAEIKSPMVGTFYRQ